MWGTCRPKSGTSWKKKRMSNKKTSGRERLPPRGALEPGHRSGPVGVASDQVTRRSPQVMEIMLCLLNIVSWTGQIKYVEIIKLIKNEIYFIYLMVDI